MIEKEKAKAMLADVGDTLRWAKIAQKVSYSELTEKTGLSSRTMQNVFEGKNTETASMFLLADALGYVIYAMKRVI